MDVQSVFYTLGSIFLILGVALMVSLLILIWKAFQTFQKAQKGLLDLKDNVQAKVQGFTSMKSTALASTLGMSISSFILKRIKSFFTKKTGFDY